MMENYSLIFLTENLSLLPPHLAEAARPLYSPTGISSFLLSLLGLLLLFVFGYAEIHYRLPFFPSHIFKKEPEIVFDLPSRGMINQQIPLFLFIKDAARFPLRLDRLKIVITPQKSLKSTQLETELRQEIHSKFFSWTFHIPPRHFPQAGNYKITAELLFEINGKKTKIKQDNYRGIPHDPFLIYISDAPLPTLPGCYWGDLHVHSNYTDDQVEFGAPIRESALCARAMGLNFLAITDHSYDLDDKPDNYLENDPYLKKWQNYLKEADRADNYFSDFVILTGEEVSAGNHKSQNVHCLLLGNRAFYHGSGDGGELLFYNLPTLSLERLFREIEESKENVIIAAAHPFDAPPYSQRKVLNRGSWESPDLAHPALDYWQILNGRRDKFFRQGLEAWKKALLNRQRIGILAGADAHGNFNCFRQVSTPFFSMVKHREQLLGQTRTGVFCEMPLTRDTLLQALREKRAIISDGPAANISVLQREKTYQLGSQAKAHLPLSVKIAAVSSKEFGELTAVELFIGDYRKKSERRESIAPGQDRFHLSSELSLAEGLPPGYLRLEARAGERLCLTNPIWIG